MVLREAQVIVSTHPQTRKHVERRGGHLGPEVELFKPLRFTDHVQLQLQAKATLSDSGTVTEESSILNFPALNIRNTHERQEDMEVGAVIMADLELDRIMEGLEILESQGCGADRTIQMVRDYDASKASEKVLRIILSYTDYVNHVVWRKEFPPA